MSDTFDLAIVGGGILGLATADRILARRPELRIVVLEKEQTTALHQTGHNSGVVHAGLYYAPGSLKATLCRAGAAALRERCAEWGVPVHERGKLVVAVSEDELPRLEELERRGRANGIEGMTVLDGDDLRTIEPHARGVRALHVPETSVVDFKLVAARLAEELRVRGVAFRFGTEVLAVDGTRIRTTGPAVDAGAVVACAGLQSDRLAAASGLAPDVRIVPFRGGYWTLRERAAALVRGLIYPVPDPGFPFLGVHFTRGHDEVVTAGPNAVPALAREGYRRTALSARDTLDILRWPGFARLAARYARMGTAEIYRELSKRAAVAEMRRYLPDLAPEDVVRGGSGIRAQAMTRDGKLVDDFVFGEGPSSLHVLNAPSPGATSSLAIGDHIADRAAERFGL
jgi:L-2-hydroxyglutarate oxidase LhgO